MRALRCSSRAPPSPRALRLLPRTLLVPPPPLPPTPRLSTPIRLYGSSPLADHVKFVESVRERRITPSPGEVRRRLQDLVRKRRPEESEQLVDTLRQSGARVFVEYMNEVINAHVTAGKLDRALQIFENLSALHLEADIATYTILITGLIKHKIPQRADTLMEEMRHRRVHPDGIFFSKVLSALCANNDLERVVKLLDAVKATPIIPSHISLCSAIQLCVHPSHLISVPFPHKISLPQTPDRGCISAPH